MFEGYDPDRRPPYKQIVIKEIDGVKWQYIYLVSNFYGGSRLISYSTKKILDDSDEAYIEDKGTAHENQRED